MQRLAAIILHCLDRLNGERTIYSIFHLLNGKRSSQTIQDAHLFSLQKYFGIYESLSREAFDAIIDSMHNKQWIKNYGSQRFLPDRTLLEHSKTLLPIYVNGWEFHSRQSKFWERLSLFIQVVSNLVFEETKYIPIQSGRDVQFWLKTILREISTKREKIGSQLFQELTACLKEGTELNPSVLVFRLTGRGQIGLTARQTAFKLNIDIHDYHVEFINSIHYLICTLNSNKVRFSLLGKLQSGLKQTVVLTASSNKTRQLLSQGHSLDTIADLRKLKRSTIEDHLVELALHLDEFSIDNYVDRSLQEKISAISRTTTTKQLKRIKEEVKNASYFQIRLVLAKYGDRTWI